MLTAITREVSASISDCELSFHARQPIDVAKAVAQHKAYQNCLAELGVRVVSLPAEPELPDAVFVEDAVVVLTRSPSSRSWERQPGGRKRAVWRTRSPITDPSSFSANLRLWMAETCCASVAAYLPGYRNAQIGKAWRSCATFCSRSTTTCRRSR